MRSFFCALTALVVIGLAFWAYRENYRTQEAQSRTQTLQYEIGEARQRLRVLNAEWAYLNRPVRLMDLVEINYDKLGLLPLQPYQFGKIDQVAYPAPPLLPITDPVDVSNSEQQP
ncbi:cell division protein FtsL [Roseovarius sp.]|uniref:cell division protein FtsL n=1 Tax=Roseovarius sp. TaxID=1486281 RepID=UPI0025E7C642|nr:cell division protein FtsL [Roseovarius sp.]